MGQSFLAVDVEDEFLCQLRILGVVADVDLLGVHGSVALAPLGEGQEGSGTPVESGRSGVCHLALYPVAVCHKQGTAVNYRLLVVLESSSVGIANCGGQQVGTNLSRVLEHSLDGGLLPNGLIVEGLLHHSLTSTGGDGSRNHGVQVSSGGIGEQVGSVGVGGTLVVQQLAQCQELVPGGGHLVLAVLLGTHLSVAVIVIEQVGIEKQTVAGEEQGQHVVGGIAGIGICHTVAHDGRKDAILELHVLVVHVLFQKTSQVTDGLAGNHHLGQLVLATSCQIQDIRAGSSHNLGVDGLFNLSLDGQLHLYTGVCSLKSLLDFLPIYITVGTLQTSYLQHLCFSFFFTTSK